MPAWPSVGRTDEQKLTEALRAGDVHAPASLFDGYAARLNDYAYARLNDYDAAADCVHDALVTAYGAADRLKEPVRLRAWLYALVRFQVAAKNSGRNPTGMTGPQLAVEEGDDPEMAALVHEALAELSRPEREVLELSLRHGLPVPDVGSVLGLNSRQANTRLTRARDHLENSAAAVILARTGRAHCPDLSAMVDTWDGPLSTILRQRLSRHIGGCEVCLEGRERHVTAAKLLDLIPVAVPPLALRRRVIDTCVNPERDQTRVMATVDGGDFDRDGFPVTVERRASDKGARRARGESRRAGKKSRRATPVVAALVCALAAAGSLAWVSAGDAGTKTVALGPTNPPATPQDPSQEPAFDVPVDEPIESGEAVAPEETPPTTRQPATPPTTYPTTYPVRSTARPTPTRPGATKPPPAAASLSMICPGDLGDASGDVIFLTARNATVDWSVSGPSTVTISPARGRLKAGATGRVVVAVDSPYAAGRAVISFRSGAGSPSCAISWRGSGDPPPGVPKPTTIPSPSRTPAPSPTPAVSETPSAGSSGNPL